MFEPRRLIEYLAYQQDINVAGRANNTDDTYVVALADVRICERDLPLLWGLGANIVHTCIIDPIRNQYVCARLLQEARIFFVHPLGEPRLPIIRCENR